MKKVIKLKWLTIAVLSLLCCVSFALIGLNQNSPKTVNADTEKTTFTSTELGIKGASPVSYSTFLSDSGITLEASDIGFAMEKGAAVRASVTTPGIRFIANLGEGFNTVQETLSSATFDFYVLVGTEGHYLFVKGDLANNGTDYQYSAAVTFNDVSELNFDEYKAKEISGQGVMVVTNGTNKTVVLADANDNERTMESVVNTAKLVGALDGYTNDVITAMNEFVPESDNYVAEKLAIQKDTGLTAGDFSAYGTVKTLYFDTNKMADITSKNTDIATIENGTSTSGYLTMVDTEGKFTNIPYQTADTVIKTASDLTKLSDSSTASTIDGYFLVANDIKYDSSVKIMPFYNSGSNIDSTFAGIFDGNGKVIEYGINRGGLFGKLTGTVRNASFIVKSVPAAQSGYTVGAGQYAILARLMLDATVENIYATYACTLDANIANSAYTVSRGIGLFGVTSGANAVITNAVVDLTKATISNLNESTGFAYGVVWNPLNNSYGGTATNVHVIWNNKTLYQFCNGDSKYFATSSNDKADGYTVAGYTDYKDSGLEKANELSTGIIRHDNYDVAKAYFADNQSALEKFEGYVNISFGLPYGGSKADFATQLGDTYYDGDTDDYEGDVAAVLPTIAGKTITKITNADDESVVYYNGSTWSNIPAVATNATVGVDYNAFVYGENDELLGATVIRSATKIIVTAKDLPSVYSYNASAATTTTGYFLVANDIDAYTENVAITPHYNSQFNTFSTFAGVFDGNGKKIEYAITRGGLFDKLTGTVKNASFIVKAVPTAATGYSTGAGQFVILARNMVNAVVENVYARYDCTLDANITNSAATVSRGVGLFGATSGANAKISNVVLDLSNVTVSNLNETTGFSYGVIWCPENAAAYYGTSSNIHVIWTNKTLYQYSNAGGTVKYFGTSSNDKTDGYTLDGYTDYAQSTPKPQDISKGITRYDTVSAMNTAGKTQVGNWLVTESGVEWVK